MLAVLVVLVSAGYFLLWRQAPSIRTDTGGYLAVAGDLADGRIDAWPARPPLYPVVVLLASGGAAEPGRALFAVQLAFHAGAILLLAAVLRRCRVGAVWVVLMALLQLLPAALLKTSFVLSEALLELLLALGVWGLATGLAGRRPLRGRLAVGALALALAPLGHPVFKLLTPVVVAALWALPWPRAAHRRSLVALTAALVGAWLLIVPGWSAWVGGRFGSPGPVSSAERLLNKLGNVAESLPEDGQGFRRALLEERDRRLLESRDHRVDGYVVRAWPRLVELAGGDERRAHAWVRRAAVDLLRREPRAYARAVAASAIRFWEPRREPMPGFRGRFWGLANLAGGALESLVWLVLAAGFGLLALLVGRRPAGAPGGGARLLWGGDEARPRQLFLLLALAVVGYAFLVAVGLGTGVPRYRWPVHALSVAAALTALDTLLGFRARLGELLRRAGPPDRGAGSAGP